MIVVTSSATSGWTTTRYSGTALGYLISLKRMIVTVSSRDTSRL